MKMVKQLKIHAFESRRSVANDSVNQKMVSFLNNKDVLH